MQRKHFMWLLIIVLTSALAMGTILAKDHGNGNGGGNGNGNGNGNPAPSSASSNNNGDNGNHHGGGNNGNGVGNGGPNGNNNGGGQEQQPPPVEPSQVEPEQVQPTAAPANVQLQSSDGLLGCQKNNPSRLDCSSLDVSGRCDSNVAVFTIRNGGEPGNGDMRAATQYRLVVDGVVVETGSVQLAGGASMQITYSGGGTVTLEADQQVGHPGNSHPRVTLNCGAAEQPTSTLPPTSTPVPTDEPTATLPPTSTPTPTDEPTATATPTVDAPVLNGYAYCMDDGSILFVVINSGGAMLDAAAYTVSDENSTSVDSGSIQLAAGEQTHLQYWGYNSLTLVVGDLVVVSPTGCVPVTEEVTPTPEPTQEVTPTPDFPMLTGSTECLDDGSILFVIINNGADMTEAAYYTVTDFNGQRVADGYVQLFSGEMFPLSYQGYDGLTLVLGDLVITNWGCIVSTPEPTQEVTPPPFDLVGSVECQGDGSVIFTITNIGDNMLEAMYYSVTTSDNGFIDDGWLQLFTNEQTSLQYWGYTHLIFTMGDLTISQDSECPQVTPEPTEEVTPTPEPTEEITPTPEPTEEVTPTPEPTEEVTPTPEPTEEVTPTAEPTQEVTPTVEPTQTQTPLPTPVDGGTLGCQKNNTGRLDCSSLQVSGSCQDGVAVFTIRNMGKRGEGDMRAPTEYRIIVDGVVVESGTVQLLGGAATQITYSGGGKVTLEADQQVGHPGKSQPQATVSCS